ncbi:MAG TPA: NDP-sugar synthase [Thermoanaerobaculia bacterium]|nr:NDP-sugar synthase [Thermoanaerobaculia bacterium]
MILAAGYGTRLRPLTYSLPKPMMPLCNRPLIGWTVEAFLHAGINDFVVNLHHLPEPIERYLRARFGGIARFAFSFEPEILGTGGGVRKVRALLERDADFYLVNGDTIQFPPFQALARTRRAHEALAALTLRHPPQHDRFTAVYLDNGRITGFGKGSGEALMFSGSHLISSRIFGCLPDRDVSGIISDAYEPAIAGKRERVAGVVDDDGLWFDIGTPARYAEAARALLAATIRGEIPHAAGSQVAGDSLIHETARINGKLEKSSVGMMSRIEPAAIVRDSAIWDGCRVGRGARLESCIVAHGVEIPARLDLANALICAASDAIPSDVAREGELVIVPINASALSPPGL